MSSTSLGWRCVMGLLLVFLVSAVQVPAQEECQECHGEPDLTTTSETGEEISLYVELDVFRRSIHGEFECVDCHADAEAIPHEDAIAPVDCGACHDDAANEYAQSVHGGSDGEEKASCSDCHGTHDILPATDVASATHPLRLATTCAVCHTNPEIVTKYHIPVRDPLAPYQRSVHGQAVLTERDFSAATCSSCHGVHDIRAMNDPQSTIYWMRVPETCGQCHQAIYAEYRDSVHGVAAAQGVRDAPICTDCHGEHSVTRTSDPDAPVHPLRVSEATCARCHEAELITARYGLAQQRLETFENSYHGLAIKTGSLTAANCASCHGIHNILPSSDPASPIYPDNLPATCGACHETVGEKVAAGPVHLTTSTLPGRVVATVRQVYLWLIAVVIGGMVVHNGLDFYRRAHKRLQERANHE